MPVTEVIDILHAEDLMPTKEDIHQERGTKVQLEITHFSCIWPGTISIERYFPQRAQR